jgi:tetratricopeptide (TPR) repeat protein
LLARVLIERGDGPRALSLLQELPQDDPGVLMLRARAALQSSNPEAIEAGLEALEAYPDEGEDALALRALQLRMRARLSATPALLRAARKLARRAPGDPDAARALGEVALELHDAETATRALEQLVASAPDDAEGHYLLGRARRMAADADGAEAALRRSLELSPSHADALVALGGLLLDRGKYAEADPIYQKLVSSGVGTLFGRLGRVEALIGLGKLDDAAVQLAGLPEKLRDGRAARETGARLSLARGKPGQALTLLRPLVDAPDAAAATVSLYADALYAAGQVNVAAARYEDALQKDAGLPEALIGRAEVHLRAERPDDALELLEQARESLQSRLRAPEVHAQMLMHFGHAYVQRDKRGDLDRARAVLLEAIELPNAPAEAHFWLGEASGGRRTPEAAAAFKRYLELRPNGRYVERARTALGPML